jgi:hypothetical protein
MGVPTGSAAGRSDDGARSTVETLSNAGAHLIAESHATPKTPDWRGVLIGSLEGFEQRRTAP